MQVESIHWVLDMTFNEDESCIRRKQVPLVFNVMRKIVMVLFKRDEAKSAWCEKKQMASLGDAYRSTLLESECASRGDSSLFFTRTDLSVSLDTKKAS